MELLKQMLTDFNEGISKSYFCLATALLTIKGLEPKLVYEIINDVNYNCFVFSIAQAMAIVQRRSDTLANFAIWKQ